MKQNRFSSKTGGSRAGAALSRLAGTTDRAEDGLLSFLYRWRTPLFLAAVTVLAFLGRTALWPVISDDFSSALHPWLNEIRQGNGFHSIGTQIGNYTAPYHYLLAAMTYIPGLSNLDVIKITSTVADFFMAGAAAALCWQLCRSKLKAALCYTLVLCLPTVFLNSAAWGQCDAMYTFFVLLFAALLLRGNKGRALFCYGIALAVKLQAIFVLPAVLILCLCGRLRFRHLLAGAASYVLLFVPAIIGSGSFAPLFRAYAMQTKVHALSSNIYNGPSLFIGVDEEFLLHLDSALIFTTFIALGAVAFYCWHNKARFTPQTEFMLIALTAVLAPFLLPAMKDRYYYVIEVMAVVYALVWPRRLAVPVLLQIGSLFSYMAYLKPVPSVPPPLGPWPVLFAGLAPLVLVWDLYRHFSQQNRMTGVAN